MAVVPDINLYERGEPNSKKPYRVPLFLVRIDGVIYASGMTFTYATQETGVGFSCSTQVEQGYVCACILTCSRGKLISSNE